MQTAINVAPEIMDWVVKQGQLEKINADLIKDFQQWQDGKKKPTFNQLETFSRATNIPLGYFFLNTPPKEDLSLLQYRTVDSFELDNPSRNLIDTIRDMENIQDWMRDYLMASDNSPLEIVASQKDNNNALSIAEIMREDMGITFDWYARSQNADDSFKRIRTIAEDLGILVMMSGIVGNNTHRPLEIEEFRAFTLIDNYAPLVFINSNDSKNGKLFSLLHELAHIWLGKDNFFNDRFSIAANVNETEILCNAVAAEILVPQDDFVQKWGNTYIDVIEDKINSIASYFKCGMTVIARRALINHYIDEGQYNAFAHKAVSHFNEMQVRKKEKDDGGGDFYRTMATRLDHRFLNAIANSAQEGKTLYTDVFRLTHTNRQTFITLVEKVRGAN